MDVRIIAASNKDLSTLVADKSFRSDLFYRLNVIPLSLPALRERKECMLPLIQHYLRHFGDKMDLESPPALSPQALNALMDYQYPGNVRELINLCERLVIICRGKRSIDYSDLPSRLKKSIQVEATLVSRWDGSTSLHQEVERLEKNLMQQAKEMFCTQEQMAKALGIQQSTVARKLQKYGLGKKSNDIDKL